MLAAKESAVVATDMAPALLNLQPSGWDNVPPVTAPNIGLGNVWNGELDAVWGKLDPNWLNNFGWEVASPFLPPLPVQGASQVSSNRCHIQQKYDA